MGESQQLTENGLIFGNLLPVCSQFALNFYHVYFNCNFHTQGGPFRDFSTWEHILKSFKFSESASTFILSWKLSLLDLICSQLSENALRAKSCVFCPFLSFETLAFFTFCWFWPSRSHWRPFLDLESTKALWLSYPNLFLHLIYLYPFPCKSSEKIDSFFMAEQSKYMLLQTQTA